MRKLTITLTAAAIAFPAHAQHAAPLATKPGCTPAARIVVERDRKAAPMKLGDQPPAAHFYAVYRAVDGCPMPVVLREGIGANPEQRLPLMRVPPRITPAE